MWYLYIVECKDTTLYTGITLDIQRRVGEHNKGRGAKSLIPKLPVKLVYSEKHRTHKKAARRELEIKKWPREKKLILVQTGA